jgi:hypothetical protein
MRTGRNALCSAAHRAIPIAVGVISAWIMMLITLTMHPTSN